MTKQSKVRDLLHADRIYKLMDSGIPYKQAVRIKRRDAELLIEAWEIAMSCDCSDDENGGIVVAL